MEKGAQEMKSPHPAAESPDFAILNNSINIDKFPKMFEGETNSTLQNITYPNGHNLM